MTRIFTLIFLLSFTVINLVGQDKKAPQTPFIENTCTSPLIGCNLFTNTTAATTTCSSASITYSAIVNNATCVDGTATTNYGCLYTQPNQTWFYFTASSSNNLTFQFTNSSNVDVDAAIWGPISNNDLNNACAATTQTPLACDYSTNANVNLSLTNVQAGSKYVMLVTDFANTATNVSITQPSGSSVTYCMATPTGACIAPTATLTGTQTIASGQTANLSVALTGTAPWSIVVNGQTYSNITTSPYVLAVSPTATTTYTLTSVSNGCGSNATTSSAVVTICTLPTATLTGTQTITSGQTANLSVALTGASPWSIIVNGQTYSNITSSPYSLTVSPTATTTYTLTSVSNSCGTKTTTSSAVVTVCSPPTANLTGTQTITSGQSANLSVALTGTSPWSIVVNGQTYSNITTSPYVFSVSPTVTTTYTLTSVNNGCGSNATTSSAVVVICSSPTATLTGTQIIANGQTANLNVAFTGTAPWSIMVNGQTYSNITTSPYILTIAPSTTTTYALTSVSNSCGTSTTSSTATVTVNYDLTYGLISCYAFSSNAVDGVGKNNGSVFGATLTTDRFNKENSAYNFNGIDNYITIPSANLNFNQFTYSVWVKPNNINNNHQFIIDNSQNVVLSNLSPNFGWTSWNYRTTQTGPATLATPLPTDFNKWYHLVVTATTNETKIYVDGVLKGTTSNLTGSPSYTNASTTAFIGKRYNDTFYFDGKIDDIKIYNRPMGDTEVGLLYNSLATDNCDAYIHNSAGLVSCYGFLGDAKDEFANNHGTANNITLVADRFGNANSAYKFAGTISSNIKISNSAPFINQNYTYSAWVNVNTLPIYGKQEFIVDIDGIDGDQSLYVSNYSGGLIFAASSYANPSGCATTRISDNSGIFVVANKWYHIVATSGNNEYKLYVDGKLVSSTTISCTNLSYGSPTYAYLGVRYSDSGGFSSPFNGIIDDVRLYNRVITSEEVNSLRYTKGCRTKCPELLTLVNPYSPVIPPTRNEAGTIIGTNSVNAGTEIRYDAQKSILLNPGFKAEQGAVFEAYIDGCGNNK